MLVRGEGHVGGSGQNRIAPRTPLSAAGVAKIDAGVIEIVQQEGKRHVPLGPLPARLACLARLGGGAGTTRAEPIAGAELLPEEDIPTTRRRGVSHMRVQFLQ